MSTPQPIPTPSTQRQRVLFVSKGNAARSPMGEALLRHHADDRFEVSSAGLDPQGIHPLTIRVLRESYIDAMGVRSKAIEDFLTGPGFDYVIVLDEDALKACPPLRALGRDVLEWPMPDPTVVSGSAEQRLQVFRDVLDAINDRIEEWIG